MNPNVLVDLGIIVALAYLVSKLFQRVGVPQVIGFMLIGIVLGRSGLHFITNGMLLSLQPFVDLALGFIGFNIGREMELSLLRRGSKAIMIILMFETLLAFTLVFLGFYVYFGDHIIALLFGALAAATAPAATVDVIWEYRARGVLTQTLLFILALDDIIGVIMTRLVIAYTEAILTTGAVSFSRIGLLALGEIGGSLALGVVLGWLVSNIVRFKHKKGGIIVLATASVLLSTGLAEMWDLSPILANITFGAALANFSEEASHSFEEIEETATPIYILFFVLIGASLDLSIIGVVLGISIMYVILRSVGKFGGVFIGGRMAKAAPVVQKNLGLCLWSQAGVTLGLAMVIYSEFPVLGAAGQELADLIISVIAVSTLIVQILGPSGVKLAIKRAGEIGQDPSRPFHLPHRPVRRREIVIPGDLPSYEIPMDDSEVN